MRMHAGFASRVAAGSLCLVAGLTFAAGCGSDKAATPSSSGGTATTSVTGGVTVFAAASLTESFTTIGKQFEGAHPGTKVTFNFAGSSALATQITQGAPADVFASAAPGNMKTVTDASLTTGPAQTFVKNQLVIAVAKNNPKSIAGLADLTRPGLKVALCAEQVPCGAAAKKALTAAGVTVTPVTQEQDVKSALSKVKLGEVDAALVYRTDVRSASNDATGVEFPESASAINEYPIAALKDGPNHPGADAFVAYVRSAEGMSVLTAAGFQAP